MKTWSLLVMAALVAGGCVAAAPSASEDAWTITTASYHEGDRLSTASSYAWGEAGGPLTFANATWTAQIEPRSEAIDKYGVERAAVPIRYDAYEDGELATQNRCFLLDGGREVVRNDRTFESDPYEWSEPLPLLDRPVFAVKFWRTTNFRWNCDVPVALGGRTLREGDALGYADVESPGRLYSAAYWWPMWAPFVSASEPGVPATFHGRAALNFTFRLEDSGARGWTPGALTVTLAEGLPGFVAADFTSAPDAPTTSFLHDELVAFEPGGGDALADRGERIPRRDPAASLVPVDPLAFDDSPWPMRYHLADAVATLRSDPTSGLEDWLAAHPRAFLGLAAHWSQASDDPTHAPKERWTLAFGDGEDCIVYESDAITHPLPGVAPVPLASLGGSDCPWRSPADPDLPDRAPQAVVPSSVLASAAARAGVPPERTGHLQFNLEDQAIDGRYGYTLRVTEAGNPAATGPTARPLLSANVDVGSGGLLATYRAQEEIAKPALVAPAAIALQEPRAGASPWSDARLSPSLVAGGLAITALLALAVRLALVPLYTRLARDSLLRHPARARLFARIRREPGVHQAALVAEVGSGNGAVRQHLDKLAAHRLVFAVGESGRVRYFASGDVPAPEARRLALLRSGSLREVYDLCAAEPALTLRAAATRLGMSAPSVYRAKRRLEREGLLPTAPLRGLVAEG